MYLKQGSKKSNLDNLSGLAKISAIAPNIPQNNIPNKCRILAFAMNNIMKVIKNKMAVDPKSGCNNNIKADKENIIIGIRKTLRLERTFL